MMAFFTDTKIVCSIGAYIVCSIYQLYMSTTHASLLSQSDMPFNAGLGCVYVNAFATDEKGQ